MILKQGVKRFDNGESAIQWWLMDPKQTCDEIIIELDKAGYEAYGREIHSSYDCTGKWFAHAPRIRRGKFKVLVTQYWGLDV